MKKKVNRKSIFATLLVLIIISFLGNTMHTEAANKSYDNSIKECRNYEDVSYDNNNKLFHYDYSLASGGCIVKHYLEQDKKTERIRTSIDDKKYKSVGQIIDDEKYGGIFYTYSIGKNFEKNYLSYDDAKGNNIFRINMKSLSKHIKEKGDFYIYDIVRNDTKVIIMMGKMVARNNKIYLLYSNAIYDLDKKKIVESNKIPVKSDLSNYKDTYVNICLDTNYIYMVRATGTVEKKNGKIVDSRRREVLVYNHNGRLVNKIDYSQYIPKCTVLPKQEITEDIIGRTDTIIDVKNNWIYLLTRKGVYRCKNTKNKIENVYESNKDELYDISDSLCDFCYGKNGKFVYSGVKDEYADNTFIHEVNSR